MRKYLRRVIQFVFFLFFPSVYTAAFGGVKYIFARLGAGEMVSISSFLAILAVLCVYTMVFGRFFCGFACAFGSFGDALHAVFDRICKGLGKRIPRSVRELPQRFFWVKYVLLVAIAILCFSGAQDRTRGMSPWDVFSMLRAGNPRLSGYAPGFFLLLLLMAGMCVWERFFCRVFCPMGAVFSLLPVLPVFTLGRSSESCGEKCSACARQCPSGLRLPDVADSDTPGDCFQCQKCIGLCPRGSIRCRCDGLRGNEAWFSLLRAAVLLALLLWLGA